MARTKKESRLGADDRDNQFDTRLTRGRSISVEPPITQIPAQTSSSRLSTSTRQALGKRTRTLPTVEEEYIIDGQPRRKEGKKGKKQRFFEVPPIPQKHEQTLRRLRHLYIASTLYLDEEVLRTLGITEEVHGMISGIGWEKFYSTKLPTFGELVLEFLSTLERVSEPEDRGSLHISFQLMEQQRTLTLEEIASIFGFPTNGYKHIPDDYNPNVYWRESSRDEEYDPRKTKSTGLMRDADRYLHRSFTKTITGRGDSAGVVNKQENFFLHCMRGNKKVDGTLWLLDHFFMMQKKTSGDLVGGGLITAIAWHFGFDCMRAPYPRVMGKMALDMDIVYNMNMRLRPLSDTKNWKKKVASQGVSSEEQALDTDTPSLALSIVIREPHREQPRPRVIPSDDLSEDLLASLDEQDALLVDFGRTLETLTRSYHQMRERLAGLRGRVSNHMCRPAEPAPAQHSPLDSSTSVITSSSQPHVPDP